MIISDIEKDFSKLNNNTRGTHYRWDSYVIVRFTPSGRATFSPDGKFHNGKYGFEERFEVQKDGRWYID